MKIEKMTDAITLQDDIKCVGRWPEGKSISKSVPIYHVYSSQAFNQLVGYAKFKNGSNGTVLYRGQSQNHNNLLPSGARPRSVPVSDAIICAMRNDEHILSFFKLDDENIRGWDQYQSVLIESVLQHYGAQTFCMDFVDNHWCALWFGLYGFENNHYVKRTGEDEKLYIYLYLADTNGACVRGLYIGEDTYTVDLRKALPSTVARPSAQHGWIVRKHRRAQCNYNDNVIGVIEINVKDAAMWLGEGTLLSQDNFFPSFSYDQGYKLLLAKQFRSGVIPTKKDDKILPQKTICNYHYADTFFCSSPPTSIIPQKHIPVNGKKKIKTILDLYVLLLEKGWCQETCPKETLWNKKNPAIGQSGITALLVQRYFGGDIYSFHCSNSTHYYNCIDGCNIDLAFAELKHTRNSNFPPLRTTNLGQNPTQLNRKNREKIKILIKKCDIRLKRKPT